jgi:hypothetical protein
MRYLSLFSGIEAVSMAWEKQGFECAAVPVMAWIGKKIKESYDTP